MLENFQVCDSPDATFELGVSLARQLSARDVLLLYGDLGAGKTLLTKGILNGLDFDIDEVTSPSFALVNLYRTKAFDVYHIDLWRVDGPKAADAVGLEEILEKDGAVTIIEWADRLESTDFPNPATKIEIKGEGDEPRTISIKTADASEISRR